MLEWDKLDERYFEQGLDRGVLYMSGQDPVAWSGLTGLDEGADGGGTTIVYRDGVIVLADVEATDFKASLTCVWFPDEFGACIGAPMVTDGMRVDSQKPQRFHMSYRSLVGKGGNSDPFGYKIHLVYNAMATIGSKQRRTLAPDSTLVEFSFDLVCTPVRLPGYRPSAHFEIDTRFISQATVTQIEDILYGTPSTPGRMPTPTELYELLNFGDAITFVKWTHPVLGECWTASGSYKNVHMNPDKPGTWQILNVNGTDHGDGTYTLSDTP